MTALTIWTCAAAALGLIVGLLLAAWLTRHRPTRPLPPPFPIWPSLPDTGRHHRDTPSEVERTRALPAYKPKPAQEVT